MTYSVNCSILLTELPLLDRPAAARAAGFDAVEFWWPFPTSTPPAAAIQEFEDAITSAGVQLTGLNFNAGDMAGGDRGLVSWPEHSAEFRANLPVVAGIGERLGCRTFNALYGNRVDGGNAEAQDALAVDNLVLAAEAVGAIGGTVLLEPVSGADRYPLKTARDVLDVLAKVHARGASNVKLLADFYHLSVNGDDVGAVIDAHAQHFGHIQVADAPGRGAPGSGQLPLADWIARSRARGYPGPIGLEYKAPAEQAFTSLPGR